MARNFWGPGGRERARAPEAGARASRRLTWGVGLVPEVLMKGESCNARSPLVSSVLSLTVNNLT